jgi:type II secretory pathway component PulF
MSMFSPRISANQLIGLCRRMSTALEAGIDARTAWTREAGRATGALKRRLLDISDGINQGYSLSDSLPPTGDYFPTIFREMIAVGEQTGHIDSVFAQLADHYQTQVTMRRTFLAAIAWPGIELLLSLGVVGLAIWLSGLLRSMTGNQKFDLLGLGLVGTHGLMIYLTILAIAGGSLWLFVRALSRGLIWIRPIQRLFLRLPGLGRALQTLALSRLAWTMHLTMNTSMDACRAIELSIRSTQNARYTDKIPEITTDIMAGSSIHEAFVQTRVFPADFLDTLAVGEQSGKVVESMGNLARQYQDRARMAMAAIAVIAGIGVIILIAGLIVALIFRIFITSYLGPINDALNNMH